MKFVTEFKQKKEEKGNNGLGRLFERRKGLEYVKV